MSHIDEIIIRSLVESGSFGCRIGICVSGGLDSVFLLDSLVRISKSSDLKIDVLHFDHQLRADSSDDLMFVSQLASAYGLRFYSESASQDLRGSNLEERAREARYEFFVRTARRENFDRLFTAHTADDQAETVIMRLVRGSGPHGLAGIPAVTDREEIVIVRPLLRISRDEIVAVALDRGLKYRDDPTNRSRDFLRNKVRLDVIPAIAKAFGRSPAAVVSRTAEIIRREDDWIGALVSEELGRWKFVDGRYVQERKVLDRYHPGFLARIVCELLTEFDTRLDWERVEEVMALIRDGGKARVSEKISAQCDGDKFSIGLLAPASFMIADFPLEVDRETVIPEIGVTLEIRRREKSEWEERHERRPEVLRAYFDEQGVSAPLIARNRRPGDRIQPMGMRGRKKVHDIFVDDKVPRAERDRIPIVCDQKEVLWIPGLRQSEVTRITANTTSVLEVVCTRNHEK